MSFCRSTPTPTLPRKRERGRTALVSAFALLNENVRSGPLSSLSRLRGRVARSSERDGWGLARMSGKG
jgi:hypothetical protein